MEHTFHYLVFTETEQYGDIYHKADADLVIAERDKVIEEQENLIAELQDKLQNVSETINETREWLLESQKLHKRCADNAVKVIAELQAQKAQAEDDCAYWKTLAQKRNLTKPPDRAKEK